MKCRKHDKYINAITSKSENPKLIATLACPKCFLEYGG